MLLDVGFASPLSLSLGNAVFCDAPYITWCKTQTKWMVPSLLPDWHITAGPLCVCLWWKEAK